MTRSKQSRARARRRRNDLSLPYARQSPSQGMSNWQVGSQALNNSGGVIGGVATPTSVPTWDPAIGSATNTIAKNSPITWQAVVITAGVSTSAPTIGRLKIDELKGRVCFSTFSAATYYVVAIGVYISEFTINTSAWDVSDPLQPNDGARDQWFFLNAMVVQGSPGTSATADSEMHMDISFKVPGGIVIGGGQALNVTISMNAGGTSPTFVASPCFRTRVGPVA